MCGKCDIDLIIIDLFSFFKTKTKQTNEDGFSFIVLFDKIELVNVYELWKLELEDIFFF